MYNYYHICKVTYYTTNNVLCDVYMFGDVRKTHERNPIIQVAKGVMPISLQQHAGRQ